MYKFRALSAAGFFLLISLVCAPLFATWDEGLAAFKAGRYQEAVSEFRTVVEQSPDSPAGYYMLGLSLMRHDQVESALEPLRKAVELGAGDPRYRLTFAQAQLQAGRSDSALATLSGQDPKTIPEASHKAYGRLVAKAATQSRKPAAALEALEKAVDLNKGSKTLWLAIAHVAQKSDRTEQAFSALTTAYGLDGKDDDLGRRTVHTAFAIAQKKPDGPRQAWYRKGFEAARKWAGESGSAEASILAGQALMGAKDFAGAVTWFEKAAERDSGDPQPHYFKARCALALKEPEAALTHARAALGRSPNQELTRKILETEGSAYRHLEDFEKAADAFGQAGDQAKVDEMKELQKLKKGNELFEKERADCLTKVTEIRKLKDENVDLKGTDVWDQLEADHRAILAACASHLKEDV